MPIFTFLVHDNLSGGGKKKKNSCRERSIMMQSPFYLTVAGVALLLEDGVIGFDVENKLFRSITSNFAYLFHSDATPYLGFNLISHYCRNLILFGSRHQLNM